jgi:outer membrane protein OmpA-like peptidoglycan-associated protein
VYRTSLLLLALTCTLLPAALAAQPGAVRRDATPTSEEDRDQDGVRNDRDECPLEPMSAHPDALHLGCPFRDVDGDGVPDSDDLCVREPAGPHADIQRRGCPDGDIDHDEVPNVSDACPQLRGRRTTEPGTNGCPRVYVTAERVVITEPLRFYVDRDGILPESNPLLQEIATVLAAHPELQHIEVQVHSINLNGEPRSIDHSRSLTRRRAEAICWWLTLHGIDGSRLEARGFVASTPIADNTTAAGQALNRRVEFVVRRPPTIVSPAY